ncbi:proline-rich domain-containing protein [Mycoplasmopsis cynos]|uniref:Lipoprotein n=2 Tax=Mycoplasmopsis cynos TaxID=171284 RepID=L0RUG4_MYCC1|nr:proline-rich domain-containing protein [Mycoplasmopsis cynos]CCP23979.1 Hypothetical protein MCYN_0247 [Mycoplasmopsis cynos C142]VEU64580.1 Uncharacterised protein [Mycoplasmopsis cynos]
MSKYKKIFSGLGLLSISTLIGAGVVACANKKPKASDSSTEAIDQNNNQGNSTTPEQEKPGPNDQGNSSKPKEGENTPGNPAPQAPKTPGKPEDSAPEKPEKAPEQGDGSSNENSGNTNETDKKDKPNEGMNKKPEKPDKDQTPPVTLEQKATLLLAEIDKNPGYPNPKAQAIMTLRNEVENIKNEAGKTEEEKLTKLKEFKTKLNKIKDALAKAIKDIDALPYPKVQLNLQKEKFAKDKFKDKLNTLTKVDEISKVLPTDWADKIKKYNEVFETIKNFINTDSLKKRFAQTDDSTSGRFTESALIWHVYETIRNKFEKEVNNSFGKEKKSEAQKFISKFSKINENGHNKNAQWLLDESKKIVSEFSKAKEEAKKSKQMV